MRTDPVLEEIHTWRAEFAERFNHDVQAMGDWLRAKQAESGSESVAFPPKPAQPRPAVTRPAKPVVVENLKQLFAEAQNLPGVQDLADDEIVAEIEAYRNGA